MHSGESSSSSATSSPSPRPDHSSRWGIGGILSPQQLHDSAWTVVDLVTDELLLVDASDDAIAAWLQERSPRMTTLRLIRDARFGSVVVPAAIRPHAEIPTVLNTGSRRTEFSADAVPGLAAGSEERLGGGVSGADVLGVSAGEATLVVAGQNVPVASLAVRASMHDPQGMVGMDVLAGTILAICADIARPRVLATPSGLALEDDLAGLDRARLVVARRELEPAVAQDHHGGRMLPVDRDAAAAQEVARAELRVQRVQTAFHPDVVHALEPEQQRAEKLRAVVRRPGRRTERRRLGRGVERQLLARLVDVEPDAGDDRPVGELGEDPRDLPPVQHHVVRPLDLRRELGRVSPRSPRRRARRRGRAPAGASRRAAGAAPRPGSRSRARRPTTGRAVRGPASGARSRRPRPPGGPSR